MKYSANEERKIDLLAAEQIIQVFLKELEPQRRKLFISRYFFGASVSEIATQYKINEHKVDAILNSLYKELNGELEQKYTYMLTEEELLYAMTAIDDRYLEEVEPPQVCEETSAEAKMMSPINWKKGVVAACCIVILGLCI
ncbi:MAG: sigma-70 family RNA polymerase sigma factor [Agathobacter sp.]|nr:sigma-70 family RNA polymerase sigma factor [Agathobacter sp.]